MRTVRRESAEAYPSRAVGGPTSIACARLTAHNAGPLPGRPLAESATGEEVNSSGGHEFWMMRCSGLDRNNRPPRTSSTMGSPRSPGRSRAGRSATATRSIWSEASRPPAVRRSSADHGSWSCPDVASNAARQWTSGLRARPCRYQSMCGDLLSPGVGTHPPSVFGEQLDLLVLHRQRRHPPRHLPSRAQRLTTRHAHRHRLPRCNRSTHPSTCGADRARSSP
jgi:hypothetical protein